MAEALRVLILEDVADDVRLAERALCAGGLACTTKCVETQEQFRRALDEWRPDAILADYRLPLFDGRAALKIARERLPQAPVIIVTGTLPDEVAVSLLREGAYDYVLKDRISRLAAAVRTAIEAARNEVARREAEERYRLVFEAARDGIALAETGSGRVIEANAELQRQSGRTLEQLRTLAIWQLGAGTEAQSGMRGLRQTGHAETWEVEISRPDGSCVSVELRVTVAEMRSRRYLLATSRDISERKEAERQLQQQLDELRRFQRVTVDRELRLQELEEELRRLRSGAGA